METGLSGLLNSYPHRGLLSSNKKNNETKLNFERQSDKKQEVIHSKEDPYYQNKFQNNYIADKQMD